MDGKWRGILGLSGLLTLFAVFSSSLADEPEFLVPANSNNDDGEFCEGYFDDNNNFHIGFHCTSNERNPGATYCCGSPTNKYCCDQSPQNGSLDIGTLVGIFVGVFVLVSLCIILCCCFCSCCICTSDRVYIGRPHRRRPPAMLITGGAGLRATLMRVRRKRRAPPVPEDASSRSGSTSQRPSRSSYQPQSYPPTQQYPSQHQQYPLRQYPQHHYPHQEYPLNYPPNYPTQPYPHPVPRSVNQSYPHCEPMVPTFAAPPPPYTATSSEQHQHAAPLQDKHSHTAEELPGPTYPPPPSPRPMSSGQAPPLLDKQSSSANEFPSVAYPPPSRRVAGPPSAPPPDEEMDYPRKM